MTTAPIYSITSYVVTYKAGKYTVTNTLDGCRERFATLHDALEFADNGELSPEAIRILRAHPNA